MKVYNEVTIDMNPESSTYGKHLSEDSCNYEGDVALCGGGGGGGDPRNPWAWASKQPGGKMPTALPSVHSRLGWGGFDFGSDIDLPDRNELYRQERERLKAQGKRTNESDAEFSRRITSKANIYADDKYNEGFRTGWYEPAFKAFVKGPVQEMMGQAPDVGASYAGKIDPGKSEFMTAEDAFSQAGISTQLASDLLSAASGQIGAGHSSIGAAGPMIAKDVQSDFAETALQMESEQTAFDEEVERIESARTEAKKTKDEQLTQSSVARAKALGGQLSDYEKAAASQAQSGMAYSAPATTGVGEFQRKEGADLRDIAMDRYEILKGYKAGQRKLRGEEDVAEGALSEAKKEYNLGLQDVLEQTASLATDIKGKGDALLSDWDTWGQSFAGPEYSIHGDTRWGGGLAGQPFFQELSSPVLTDLTNLTSEVGGIAGDMIGYLQGSLGEESAGV